MIKYFKHKVRVLAERFGYNNRFLTTDYLEREIVAGRAVVGRHSYGRVRLIGTISSLFIGNFCSIAEGCTVFVGHYHRPDFVTTYPFNVIQKNVHAWDARHITGHPASKGDVHIGHDVWIGMNTTILSGVSIGSGAVIGAHALVTQDVEPYSIVGGNPARHRRYRFDEDARAKLLSLEWWHWSDDVIKAAIPLLMSTDLSVFFEWCETHGKQ